MHPSFPPPTYHDLLSPGLWIILEKYISICSHLSVLPFYFSKTERKLYFVRQSFLERVILKLSPIIFAATALIISVLPVRKLLSANFEVMSGQDDRMDMIRTFSMLYGVFSLPIFNPISYLIAYRGLSND